MNGSDSPQANPPTPDPTAHHASGTASTTLLDHQRVWTGQDTQKEPTAERKVTKYGCPGRRQQRDHPQHQARLAGPSSYMSTTRVPKSSGDLGEMWRPRLPLTNW